MPLDDFFSVSSETKIPAGHAIFHQGDVCQNYFLLTEGTVKVFTRSAAGKEVVLYQVVPGDMCVLTTTCLLGNQRFPAEAAATTDLVVRIMPKSTFDELMDNSAEFRQHVFASYAHRMGTLIQTIEKLALESIEQRLAKYLLLQPGNPIQVTHQSIASQVSTAREVVSRNLKRFEEQGWIRLGRGQVELLDREALHQLI